MGATRTSSLAWCWRDRSSGHHPLLDELWEHATRAELAWTQRWQVGDLIIWDNRCTMHRRDGFAGHGRRRMHRLMTRGERPV